MKEEGRWYKMKIKSTLIIVSMVLVLINNVYAIERILEVSLEIAKDGEAKINNIKTNTGFTGNYNTGNYSLVLDYGKKTETYRFSPNFYLRILDKESMHRDIEIPIARETLYLPYSDDLFSIKVLNGVETVAFLSLGSLLCNNDGLCQKNENFVGCQSDCNSYEKDGVCMNIKYDRCDPDCSKDQDYECTGNLSQFNIKTNNLRYSLYGLLGIVILYLIYRYLKKS